MRIVMIALMLSTAAFAQVADGERPAFPPALEKFLGLAAGQADAILDANELFRNDTLRQEKAETLRQQRAALSGELNSESPDPGVVGTLVVDIEILDRELRAMKEAHQQAMLADIFGVSPGDEEPVEIVKRLHALERAKRIEPIFNMAARFNLVDTRRQMRQNRRESGDQPAAE